MFQLPPAEWNRTPYRSISGLGEQGLLPQFLISQTSLQFSHHDLVLFGLSDQYSTDLEPHPAMLYPPPNSLIVTDPRNQATMENMKPSHFWPH